MINTNPQLFYYIFSLIILFLFLFSTRFKIKFFYKFIKKLFKFLFKRKQKNYTNQNELINAFIPQEKIKNLIQDDLPFINSDKNPDTQKINFKLPLLIY